MVRAAFVSSLRSIALVSAIAIASSCSSTTSPSGSLGGGGNNGGSTSDAISVLDNSFSPSATTVPVNTTVTWTWGGSSNHNVTFDDGPASATQSSGTYQRNFTTAGTYHYHCTIHGQAMSGTVTVQ